MQIKPRFPALLLASLLMAGSTGAQSEDNFRGTWKGEHAGKPYLEMTIETVTPLLITFATAHIHVGESGEIDMVAGPVIHAEHVLEANLDDGVLRLKNEQESGYIVEYEMRLDGATNASLRIKGAPEFVKPFRLRRT